MKKLLSLVAAAALLFVTCVPEAKVDNKTDTKPGNNTEAPEELPVESITLSQETLELVEGETARLTATVAPDNATDKTVTWTSNKPEVVSVDASGLVTAVSAGEAKITASAGEKSATCSVTVTPAEVPVTEVIVAPATLELEVGVGFQLKATIKPDNASVQTVAWSSSAPEIVSVDDTGYALALSAGDAVITATAGGKQGTCSIHTTPVDIPVTGISINPQTLTLSEGETFQLTAILTPDNATNKTVIWSSDDTKVACVDKNGFVTAMGAGNTYIKACAGDKEASCAVIVSAGAVAVTGIRLSETSLKLHIGETCGLTAIVEPDNATDKTVSWSSDHPEIVKVTGGFLEPLTGGTATITASAGGFSATCEVTVIPELTGIALNYSSLAMMVGDVVSFVAIPIPDGAELPGVPNWTTTNNAVIIVTEVGTSTLTIQAVGGGNATVEATVGTFTAQCSITVVATTKSLPYLEDFEDPSTLEEWTFVDADGDGNGWWHNTYTDPGIDLGHLASSAHSGLGSICSSSFLNSTGQPLTPDNWLFTPPVKLSSKSNYLSFWVAPQDPSWPADKYAVYVSTEASANAENCTELLTETLYTLGNRDDYLNHVIHLPEEFNGQVVYIAFRHFDCTDNFQMKLDDVSITEDKPAASAPRRAHASGKPAARKK